MAIVPSTDPTAVGPATEPSAEAARGGLALMDPADIGAVPSTPPPEDPEIGAAVQAMDLIDRNVEASAPEMSIEDLLAALDDADNFADERAARLEAPTAWDKAKKFLYEDRARMETMLFGEASPLDEILPHRSNKYDGAWVDGRGRVVRPSIYGASAGDDTQRQIHANLESLVAQHRGYALQELQELNKALEAHLDSGTPMDFSTFMKRMNANIFEYVPFSPAQWFNAININHLAKRYFEDGLDSLDELEQMELSTFLNEGKLRSLYKQTTAAGVTELIVTSIPWAIELSTLYTRAGVKILEAKALGELREGLGKQFGKEFVDRRLVRVGTKAGVVAGVTAPALTGLQPHRVAAAIENRFMPLVDITKDQAGQIQLRLLEEAPPAVDAVYSGLLESYLETGTELLGPFFGKGPVRALLKKLPPGLKARIAKHAFLEKWIASPARKVGDVGAWIADAQWNGPWQELGEEFANRGARGFFGLNLSADQKAELEELGWGAQGLAALERTGKDLWPGMHQFMIEAIGMYALGGLSASAQMRDTQRRKKRYEDVQYRWGRGEFSPETYFSEEEQERIQDLSEKAQRSAEDPENPDIQLTKAEAQEMADLLARDRSVPLERRQLERARGQMARRQPDRAYDVARHMPETYLSRALKRSTLGKPSGLSAEEPFTIQQVEQAALQRRRALEEKQETDEGLTKREEFELEALGHDLSRLTGRPEVRRATAGRMAAQWGLTLIPPRIQKSTEAAKGKGQEVQPAISGMSDTVLQTERDENAVREAEILADLEAALTQVRSTAAAVEGPRDQAIIEEVGEEEEGRLVADQARAAREREEATAAVAPAQVDALTSELDELFARRQEIENEIHRRTGPEGPSSQAEAHRRKAADMETPADVTLAEARSGVSVNDIRSGDIIAGAAMEVEGAAPRPITPEQARNVVAGLVETGLRADLTSSEIMSRVRPVVQLTPEDDLALTKHVAALVDARKDSERHLRILMNRVIYSPGSLSEQDLEELEQSFTNELRESAAGLAISRSAIADHNYFSRITDVLGRFLRRTLRPLLPQRMSEYDRAFMDDWLKQVDIDNMDIRGLLALEDFYATKTNYAKEMLERIGAARGGRVDIDDHVEAMIAAAREAVDTRLAEFRAEHERLKRAQVQRTGEEARARAAEKARTEDSKAQQKARKDQESRLDGFVEKARKLAETEPTLSPVRLQQKLAGLSPASALSVLERLEREGVVGPAGRAGVRRVVGADRWTEIEGDEVAGRPTRYLLDSTETEKAAAIIEPTPEGDWGVRLKGEEAPSQALGPDTEIAKDIAEKIFAPELIESPMADRVASLTDEETDAISAIAVSKEMFEQELTELEKAVVAAPEASEEPLDVRAEKAYLEPFGGGAAKRNLSFRAYAGHDAAALEEFKRADKAGVAAAERVVGAAETRELAEAYAALARHDPSEQGTSVSLGNHQQNFVGEELKRRGFKTKQDVTDFLRAGKRKLDVRAQKAYLEPFGGEAAKMNLMHKAYALGDEKALEEFKRADKAGVGAAMKVVGEATTEDLAAAYDEVTRGDPADQSVGLTLGNHAQNWPGLELEKRGFETKADVTAFLRNKRAPRNVDAAAADAEGEDATDAQKDAGNYKKGHFTVDGEEISIENEAGTKRREEWPELPAHYGYIRRTEGVDGDQVDVFIRTGTSEEDLISRNVYVIDQVDKETGDLDEHKAMLGFATRSEAVETYQAAYDKDAPTRAGKVEAFAWRDFRKWVHSDAPRNEGIPKPEPPQPPGDIPLEDLFTPIGEWSNNGDPVNGRRTKKSVDLWAQTYTGDPQALRDMHNRLIEEMRLEGGSREAPDMQGMANLGVRAQFFNEAAKIVSGESAPGLPPSARGEPDIGTIDNINVQGLADRFGDRLDEDATLKTWADVEDAIRRWYGVTALASANRQHMQNAYELALIRTAERIVKEAESTRDAFNRLQKLSIGRAEIGKRSAQKIQKQQYSTPEPYAYVAGLYAGLPDASVIADTSAGNGMLEIAGPTEDAEGVTIILNDIDPVRAANLRASGYTRVTEENAETIKLREAPDSVILNPPFGQTRGAKIFDGFMLTDTAHVQAAQALSQATDDVRAVIIIGGEMIPGAEREIPGAQRMFFNWLYENYNVVQNFAVAGGEYRKMGTRFPTRMIVINGRRKQSTEAAGEQVRAIDRAFKTTIEDIFNQWQEDEENERLARQETDGEPGGVEVAGRGTEAGARGIPGARGGPGTTETGEGDRGVGPEGLGGVRPGEGTGTGGAAGGALPGAGVPGGRPDDAGGGGRAGAGGVAAPDQPGGEAPSGPADTGTGRRPLGGKPAGGAGAGEVPEPEAGTPGPDVAGGIPGPAGLGAGSDVSPPGKLFDDIGDDIDDDVTGKLFMAGLDPSIFKMLLGQGRTFMGRAPEAIAQGFEDPREFINWSYLMWQAWDPKIVESLPEGAGEDLLRERRLKIVGNLANVYNSLRRDPALAQEHKDEMTPNATVMGYGADALIEALMDVDKLQQARVGAKRKKAAGSLRREAAEREREELVMREENRLRLAEEGASANMQYIARSRSGHGGAMVPFYMQQRIERALADIEAETGMSVDEYLARELGIIGEDEPFTDEVQSKISAAWYAEQVDAIVLAIRQWDKPGYEGLPQAAIIGNDTGTGKGRIGAALVYWGILHNKRVIFMTADAGLMQDLWRDLLAIAEVFGWESPNPFNVSGAAIMDPRNTDKQLFPAHSQSYKKRIWGSGDQDDPGGEYQLGWDATFMKGKNLIQLPYSQIQSKASFRKIAFIQKAAEGAMIIADESHRAAGETSNTGQTMRGILGMVSDDENAAENTPRGTPAELVTYLSATFAKRPTNLVYYFRTILGMANLNFEELADILLAGGTPMQEFIAEELASAGQLMRVEKDYGNVRFDMVDQDEVAGLLNLDKKDLDAEDARLKKDWNEHAARIRELVAISRVWEKSPVRREILRHITQVINATVDKGDQQRSWGITSQSFISRLHSVVAQGLLSARVNSVARAAIAHLRADANGDATQKVVITTQFTLGAVLGELRASGAEISDEEVAEAEAVEGEAEEDIETGEEIPPNISHALFRTLRSSVLTAAYKDNAGGRHKTKILYNRKDGTISYEFTDASGSKMSPSGEHYGGTLPIEPVFARLLEDWHRSIETYESSLPYSPLDALRERLLDMWPDLKIGEATGRKTMIDGGRVFNRIRADEPGADTETTRYVYTTRKMINVFNNGGIDVLIGNQTISTGLSMHASPEYPDTRKRVMIAMEVHQVVDTQIQIFGRVNRYGQLSAPDIFVFRGWLPAEIRPLAVLMKKMASLNANTSAKSGGNMDLNTPDILNKYGDEVVHGFLSDNDFGRELGESLGYEYNLSQGKGTVLDAPVNNLATTFTGRLAIVDVEIQERFYAEVVKRYDELISDLDRQGKNDLKTQHRDYRAKLKKRELLARGSDNRNGLTADVYMGEYEVDNPNKPMEWEKVTALAARNRGSIEEAIRKITKVAIPYIQQKFPETAVEAKGFGQKKGMVRMRLPKGGDWRTVGYTRMMAAARASLEILRSIEIGELYDIQHGAAPYAWWPKNPTRVQTDPSSPAWYRGSMLVNVVTSTGVVNPANPGSITLVFANPGQNFLVRIALSDMVAYAGRNLSPIIHYAGDLTAEQRKALVASTTAKGEIIPGAGGISKTWPDPKEGKEADKEEYWNQASSALRHVRVNTDIVTGNLINGLNLVPDDQRRNAQIVTFTMEDGTIVRGIHIDGVGIRAQKEMTIPKSTILEMWTRLFETEKKTTGTLEFAIGQARVTADRSGITVDVFNNRIVQRKKILEMKEFSNIMDLTGQDLQKDVPTTGVFQGKATNDREHFEPLLNVLTRVWGDNVTVERKTIPRDLLTDEGPNGADKHQEWIGVPEERDIRPPEDDATMSPDEWEDIERQASMGATAAGQPPASEFDEDSSREDFMAWTLEQHAQAKIGDVPLDTTHHDDREQGRVNMGVDPRFLASQALTGEGEEPDAAPKTKKKRKMHGKEDLFEPKKKTEVRPETPHGKPFGEWDEESLFRLEMPELIKYIRGFLDDYPKVHAYIQKSAMFQTYGYWTVDRRTSKPKLVFLAEIAQKPGMAAKVVAHEIGHFVDYMPQWTMRRGNLLGRIGSLIKYLKTTLPLLPTNDPEAQIPAGRRKELHNQAAKDARAALGKKPDPTALAEATAALYKDAIEKEANAQGLLTLRKAQEELFAAQDEWNPMSDWYFQKGISSDFKKSLDKWNRQYRRTAKEVYADALSYWFNNPTRFAQVAPTVHKALMNYMEVNKPEAFAAYWSLMSDIASGKHLDDRLEREYQHLQESDDLEKERSEQARRPLSYHLRQMRKGVWRQSDPLNMLMGGAIPQEEQEKLWGESIAEARAALPKGTMTDEVYEKRLEARASVIYRDKKRKSPLRIKRKGRMTFWEGEEDPLADWTRMAYMDGPLYAYRLAINERILGPLEAMDLPKKIPGLDLERDIDPTDHFALYLMFLRIEMGDRAGMFNPSGFDAFTANTTRERFGEYIGKENMRRLGELQRDLWEIRNQYVIPVIQDAEMWGSEVMNKIEDNQYYVTFNVTKFLDDIFGEDVRKQIFEDVGHQIKRQVGTFEQVENVLHSTIVNDASLIRAAIIMRAKKRLVQWMALPSEIEEDPERQRPAGVTTIRNFQDGTYWKYDKGRNIVEEVHPDESVRKIAIYGPSGSMWVPGRMRTIALAQPDDDLTPGPSREAPQRFPFRPGGLGWAPDEILPAKYTVEKKMVTVDGMRRKVSIKKFSEKSAPVGFKLMIIKDFHRTHGYYVPEGVAKLYESNPLAGGELFTLMQAMSAPLKALYTSHNPWWVIWNIQRDVRAAAIQLPKARLLVGGKKSITWQLFRSMRDAYEFAFNRRAVWYDKAGVKHDIVDTMLKGQMLLVGRVGYSQSDLNQSSEAAMARLMVKTGVEYERDKKGARGFLRRIWDGLDKWGQMWERAVKIASYRYLTENTNLSDAEIATLVITRGGSPDFRDGGSVRMIYNSIFLFSNAQIVGARGALEAMGDSKTEYWLKMTAYNLAPKLMMWAAAAGVLDAIIASVTGRDPDKFKYWQRLMAKIPEHDKLARIIIPLGETKAGEAIYLLGPHDFVGEFFAGNFWILLNNLQHENKFRPEDVVQFLSNQNPASAGLNPFIRIVTNWWLASTGHNPYDHFYRRKIVRDEIFNQGPLWSNPEAAMQMGIWSYNSTLGAWSGPISQSDITPVRSTIGEVFSKPFGPGAAVRRLVRVSKSGETEAITLSKEFREMAEGDHRQSRAMNKIIAAEINALGKEPTRREISVAQGRAWRTAEQEGSVPDDYRRSYFNRRWGWRMTLRFGDPLDRAMGFSTRSQKEFLKEIEKSQ